MFTSRLKRKFTGEIQTLRTTKTQHSIANELYQGKKQGYMVVNLIVFREDCVMSNL